MASTKGKLVEGVDVFTADEPKAKKAPSKAKPSTKAKAASKPSMKTASKPTAKKTASKSLATTKSAGKVTKVSRADRINELYEKAQGIAGKAVEELTPIFIEIGNELIAQKEELKHGDWIPWIEENLPFNRDGAARYMRAARNASRVTHLPSLRQAVALLSDGTEDAEVIETPEQEADDPDIHKLTTKELDARIRAHVDKVKKANDKEIADAKEREKKARAELAKLKEEGVGTAAEKKKLSKLQSEVNELVLRRNTLQVLDEATSVVADANAALARLAAYPLSEDVLEERADDIDAMEGAIENMGEFVKEHLRV